MITKSLNSQEMAVDAIRNGNYIVGFVSSDGTVSFAIHPAIQVTNGFARAECARLAKLNPGKMYVFVKVMGAEISPVKPTTSY